MHDKSHGDDRLLLADRLFIWFQDLEISISYQQEKVFFTMTIEGDINSQQEGYLTSYTSSNDVMEGINLGIWNLAKTVQLELSHQKQKENQKFDLDSLKYAEKSEELI